MSPTVRVRNDLQKGNKGVGEGRINYFLDAAVNVMGFLLELSFLFHNLALWLDLTLLSQSFVYLLLLLFLGVESGLQDDGKASFNPKVQK